MERTLAEPIHAHPTAVHALPAQLLPCGFRFLALRQFLDEPGPPVFAFIDQDFVRSPQRLARHGLWFAAALRPDIVAWLTERLGRPSLRDAAEKPLRNPQWPRLDWRSEARVWPDGVSTLEWSIELGFDNSACWPEFRRCFADRLNAAPKNPEEGA